VSCAVLTVSKGLGGYSDSGYECRGYQCHVLCLKRFAINQGALCHRASAGLARTVYICAVYDRLFEEIPA